MKIKDIKRTDNIYTVTFTPNWIERLFGVKEQQKSYKATGDYYRFGGYVYTEKSGKELSMNNRIGRAIDLWRRKW